MNCNTVFRNILLAVTLASLFCDVVRSQESVDTNFNEVCIRVNNPMDHTWGGYGTLNPYLDLNNLGEFNLIKENISIPTDQEFQILKKNAKVIIHHSSRNKETLMGKFQLSSYLKYHHGKNAKKLLKYIDMRQLYLPDKSSKFTVIVPEVLLEVYFEPQYANIIIGYLNSKPTSSLYVDLLSAAKNFFHSDADARDATMKILLVWGTIGSSMKHFTDKIFTDSKIEELNKLREELRYFNNHRLFLSTLWESFVTRISTLHFYLTPNYMMPSNIIIEDNASGKCIVAKSYHFWLAATLSYFMTKDAKQADRETMQDVVFNSGKGYEYFSHSNSGRNCRPHCILSNDNTLEIESTRLYLALKGIGIAWGSSPLKDQNYSLEKLYKLSEEQQAFKQPFIKNKISIEKALDKKFSIKAIKTDLGIGSGSTH